MSEFQVYPLLHYTYDQIDYWIMYKRGNITEPLAVIPDYEMRDIVKQYNEKKAEAEKAISQRKECAEKLKTENK